MKKNKLKSSSGGALLFAIITAFVVSFIAASLVLLTTNQYKIINNEINRKIAYYKIRAGVEYTNYYLYTNPTVVIPPAGLPLTCPDHSDLAISILNDTTGVSRYSIQVRTNY